MPRRTESQNIAINILDYLFLHDVASMVTFSDAKNSFYSDLLGTLVYINSARNHNGVKAEIYQHFILCGIELIANYSSHPTKELDIQIEIIFNKLTDEVVKYGFLADEFISDLNELNNEYQLYDRAKELTYKLVAQCLYFDFDSTAFFVFHKFLNMRILNSGKFKAGKIKQDGHELLEKVFLRAMLFLEFELLKNKYFKEDKESLIEIDISVIQINIKNKKEVNKYLSNISYLLDSESIFFTNFPDCAGLISSWFFLEKYAQGNAFTRHKLDFEDNKSALDSDTQEEMNDFCSKVASKKMKEYNYTIKPRAIYNHALRFDGFCNLIKILFEKRSKLNYILYYPDFNEPLLDKCEMPPIFQKGLEISKNKLRK